MTSCTRAAGRRAAAPETRAALPSAALRKSLALGTLVLIGIAAGGGGATRFAARAADGPAPATVEELWADFDPRRDPLDVQVVREWDADGLRYRYVTFHVGSFRGQAARLAAFYAFPQGAARQPALLHLHGGGQRAFLHEVEFYARQGYPCLSINWGGREMERAEPGDPNTAWGAVDPTQANVPGYFNLLPGERTLDPYESPRNNNWYLLTLGARRGLTFLEQQPEVDPERLGVYGHSMGGNLTVYVAGSDRRVRAAAPSVGGSGFATAAWPLLPEHRPRLPNGDRARFDATLGFESYAPRITAPLLWLGSTNDFHGLMDDTYRTGALIPHARVRYAFTPHMNHRFTPEFAVTRPLWFDEHLRGRFTFPQTPATELDLNTADGVPAFRVTPDAARPVAEVRVYYAIDPDPRARFWRSADARPEGRVWTARLPVLDVARPLLAFANVAYGIESRPADAFAPPTERFAISSQLHTAAPADLQRAGVRATDRADPLIDDFAEGWRDWYALSVGNPHHWEFSTRKLTDPKWRGQPGQRLSLEVRSEQPNALVLVVTENFFRQYRGPMREYVAVVPLSGGPRSQTVAVEPGDFAATGGAALASWDAVDLLSLRAYYEADGTLLGSKNWAGPLPEFRKLWWAADE